VKEPLLIGVDLGTSSTKASIYRVDGSLIAQASVEIPIYRPTPGVVEQDSDNFYQSAASMVRRCVQESGIDPRQVAAIAFDSQMAGVGSVDEDFRPATRFDSWLDMRCQPYIELMDRQAGNQLTELTGCPPTCDHGPKMLWWKNERPEKYRRVTKFIMPAGYVAGLMAGLKGEEAFVDYTFIHFSGFSDAKQTQWSEELCSTFGLDMDKLPRIVEPWEVVGEVTEKCAKEFGLVPGIPIAAGAGDTAANALGAGIVEPGMVFDVAGTAAVLAGCTSTYIADTKNRAILTMRSVIPGLWNPLAYIAGGGLALRWFRDQFFNANRGIPQSVEDELYPEMIGLAASVSPGSEGLFFSPHLGGRICPASPDMRGAWIGVSWSHTQAHFARALLESVAYEYAYYLRILRELLPSLELIQARTVGGGARSQIWNQIKADVLGVAYQPLRGNEFGTWGAAMIAGKAAGIIDDLATHAAQTVVVDGKPVAPDNDIHLLYEPLVEKYIQMQQMLDQFFINNAGL
jgi:xylulokinase